MTKPTCHSHVNIPFEACKHFELADGWTIRQDVCPESLQIGDPTKCPPLKWWPFKTEDLEAGRIPKCEMHSGPVVPDIVKCDIPYWKTRKLLTFTGAVLTELSMKDGPAWKEEDYPLYLDALVKDGVNSIRSFSWGTDGTPDWDYWTPMDDGWAQYASHLRRRLAWIRERDLTAILCVKPYQGHIEDADVSYLVDATMEFIPNIIYECENEPAINYDNQRISRILKMRGVPNEHILIDHFNAADSAWGALWQSMPGRLGSRHWCGSPETINAPHPTGWASSPEWLELLSRGMTGSNDGEDDMKANKGIYFFEGNPASRRPTLEQLFYVTQWCSINGHGYENLSASGFQATTFPDMDGAITLGQEERRTMREAWNDAGL